MLIQPALSPAPSGVANQAPAKLKPEALLMLIWSSPKPLTAKLAPAWALRYLIRSIERRIMSFTADIAETLAW